MALANSLAVDYTVFANGSDIDLAGSGAVNPVSIGLAALVLSVIHFVSRASMPMTVFEAGWSRVRIAVALNLYEGMDADGDGPDIRLWAENGYFNGMKTDVGFITDGTYKDMDIHHIRYHDQQPTYMLLSANNNAVCLAYVQQTWADDQNVAWAGNWGRTCDKEWYHSGIVMDGKSLECTWIDKNGDKTTTGLQIHYPDFMAKGEPYDHDAEYLCNHDTSLGFRTEPDPSTLTYYLPATPTKRSFFTKLGSFLRPRASTLRPHAERPRAENVPVSSNHLVKSNLTTHTASSLCDSKSSRGPDFVSHAEGQFCDMETKTLWPICASAQDKGCFDNEAHDVRLAGSVGKRDEPVMAFMKNYTRFTHWD